MPSWSYIFGTPTSSSAPADPKAGTSAIGGKGIRSPFRRAENDLATSDGVETIKNNLANILGVRAGNDYAEGELPWRTEFGSLLHLLRHKQNNQATREMARIWLIEAVARWESRVIIRDVKAAAEKKNTGDTERPILGLQVIYDIRARSGSILARNQTLDL